MTETLQPKIIGPDILLASNKSEEASSSIDEWYKAKKVSQLTVVSTCSDARVEGVPIFGIPTLASIRSIAAAGSRKPLAYLLNHSGVCRVVVAGHFDGATLQLGMAPGGCGGLKAKKEDPAHLGIVGDFIRSQVATPDVVYQAFLSADLTARYTQKPVLAAVINHRTGVVYPIAQFSITANGNRQIISAVNIDDFRHPDRLYAKGEIPQLDTSDLDDEFIQLLDGNKEQVARLRTSNPDFYKTQEVQNPKLIILSTSPIPAAIRYPDITGNPNTGFTVTLAFEKNDNGQIVIREDNLREALTQIVYPISHAVHSSPGEMFFDSTNILIETPKIDLSKYVAQELGKMRVVKLWQKKRQGKIMTAQITAGRTTAISYFQ